MGRILAIDYGRKRCGIAVTDILQIAANGLPTVRSCDLMDFLMDYCRKECVDKIIVGLPKTMSGLHSESMNYIRPFLHNLHHNMPDMTVELFDERFTSVIAHREMIAVGLKKSKRAQKGLADETAAVLILTDYLNSRK